MKRGKAKVFLTLLVILIAGIYYYVTIPAVNIHASKNCCTVFIQQWNLTEIHRLDIF